MPRECTSPGPESFDYGLAHALTGVEGQCKKQSCNICVCGMAKRTLLHLIGLLPEVHEK